MDKDRLHIKNIDIIRNNIVDAALSISVIFLFLGGIFSSLRFEQPFQSIFFIAQFVVLIAVVAVTIFRKKLKLGIKVTIIIVAFYTLMVSGMYNWGFLASSKAYILFLPIFATFILPYRKAILLLIVLVATYILFSYLHITGRLTAVGDPVEYITFIPNWALDIVVLGATSFACLYIGKYFSDSIISNISSLEKTDNISKRRKEKLIESEERYKTLVDSFPDMIMITDVSMNVVYGNDNLAKMTGLYPEDYNNPERKTRVHPDDREMVQAIIAGLIKSDQISTPIFENRIFDRWGNIHWHSGTISKIYINNELHLQVVTRDITEKKKVELELEEHRKNLEKLVKERTADLENLNEELRSNNEELTSKSRIIAEQNSELMSMMENLKVTQSKLIEAEKMASLGVLTSGVSHELNNPLNFIQGGYTGLENYLSVTGQLDNKDIPVLLHSIKTGIERASKIVGGLNQFGRQSTNLDEECNLQRIIDNAISLLGREIHGRIVISQEFQADSTLLHGNRGALQRTIYNILRNAVQAIENKGEIHILTKQLNAAITIEISDTGCGIPAENISRVTEPFFTTREVGKGTGLGLSVAYSTIKEHSGKLKIDSKPGKGTKITIILPSERQS